MVRDVFVHGAPGGYAGIKLGNVTNGTIADATASDSWAGIVVSFGTRIDVIANNLSKNLGAIHVENSRNVSVLRNGITDNATGAGISVTATENFAVMGNRVTNTSRGIVVQWPSRGEVRWNEVRSSTSVGIRLQQAAMSNVTVSHNVINGNLVQAEDDGGAQNRWDEGYPSGGNYWSDYGGMDHCSGPDQDVCPAPDGIGDTPYVIDEDSRDRYPLMAPANVSWPLPPTVSAATLGGAAFADFTIAWTPSPTEGMANGTVAYRVMRAIGDIAGPYVEIDTVPADGSSSYAFTCAGCGHVPGDTTPHFYKVRAVDASNNTADSNLAARYARPLAAGTNLLTVPLRQANDSLSAVLQTVGSSVVSVRTYEAANASDPWKAYVTAKGHGEITTLPFGAAFWVNVTAAGQYTVAGLLVERPTVLLRPGWNLVAYASLANETVAASLAGLPVTRVEAFAAVPDPYKLRVAAADETLVWGEAYWVCATAEGVWTQG